MHNDIKEIVYRCSNQKCKHEQTIRHSHGEIPLAVTCCVKCRAGFGVTLDNTAHIGMFPVRELQAA